MIMNLIAYRAFPMYEFENKLIENIDKFLSTKAQRAFSRHDLQPFKEFTKNLELKLDLPEYNITANPCGYIQFNVYQNASSTTYRTFYYFVDRVERLANETIRLFLTMDVINTYSNIIISNLSPKTMVLREHRSRFNIPTSTDTIRMFTRRFDKIKEELSPALFRSKDLTDIKTQYEDINNHFYLIYKTPDNINKSNLQPIQCEMLNDAQLLVRAGGTAQPVKTLKATDIQENQFYYILRDDSPTALITLTSLSQTAEQSLNTDMSLSSIWKLNAPSDFNNNDYYCYGIIFQKVNSNLKAYPIMQYKGSQDLPLSITLNTDIYLILNSAVLDEVTNIFVSTSCTSQINDILEFSTININSGTTGALYSQPFNTYDKTDSRLVKIIQLPYAPSNVNKNTKGEYNIDNFTYKNGIFILNDINTNFLNTKFTPFLLDNTYLPLVKQNEKSLLLHTRYIRDSKLYTSEFYITKFIYDNFNFSINYEDYEFNNTITIQPMVNFKFKITNTINSNFAFKFELTNISSFLVAEDYLYLVSSRNNEITIYNNDYINYIRTGYNYDKKAKSLASINNWAGFGLSGLSSTMALATNPATAPFAAVGMAGSLLSSITSQINADNNFQEKQETLKRQSTSVSGVDDIDILNFYNGNHLQASVYKVNDETFKSLDDLFYYYGYKTNKMRLPATDTRKWFNFIQIEPVFIQAFQLENHIEEITQKLKEGVTIFHENNGEWDLSQVKENYEVDVFNALIL